MTVSASRDPAIGVDNWGTVRIPSMPFLRKYALEEQKKTYNVIVSSLMVSSPKKIADEMAFEYSNFKWDDTGFNMFNVTLLTSRDNKKAIDKKSKNFTPFLLPYNDTDIFDHNGPIMPEFLKHENNMVDLLVKEDSNLYKDALHSVKFDAGLTSFMPSEKIILKMHDVPFLQWNVVLAEPIISIFSGTPWFMSTALPLMTPNIALMH